MFSIGRRDIGIVPRPSGVGFLTGSGLLWGGNLHPAVADLGTVDDRFVERSRYGAQSVGQE